MPTRKAEESDAVVVEMTYEKSTKNKHVYKYEAESADETTSFYAPKTWFDGTPESITVSVKV